jgi:hypothetical protein
MKGDPIDLPVSRAGRDELHQIKIKINTGEPNIF